jgi:hypothetical protein
MAAAKMAAATRAKGAWPLMGGVSGGNWNSSCYVIVLLVHSVLYNHTHSMCRHAVYNMGCGREP